MDDHYELQGTTFIWNRDKAHRNEVRHEVTFKEAAQAFFDPFLRVVDAGRNDEARDAVVGYDIRGRLLYVVHVVFENEAIRLISARKASRPERETYDS